MNLTVDLTTNQFRPFIPSFNYSIWTKNWPLNINSNRSCQKTNDKVFNRWVNIWLNFNEERRVGTVPIVISIFKNYTFFCNLSNITLNEMLLVITYY